MTMAAAIADQVARPIPRDRQPAVSLVFASKPPWLESVESQIAELPSLPFGWDAFGAGPLRYDVLWFALSLLETVMSDDTPPPHVTPMSHEGIMLECIGMVSMSKSRSSGLGKHMSLTKMWQQASPVGPGL